MFWYHRWNKRDNLECKLNTIAHLCLPPDCGCKVTNCIMFLLRCCCVDFLEKHGQRSIHSRWATDNRSKKWFNTVWLSEPLSSLGLPLEDRLWLLIGVWQLNGSYITEELTPGKLYSQISLHDLQITQQLQVFFSSTVIIDLYINLGKVIYDL